MLFLDRLKKIKKKEDTLTNKIEIRFASDSDLEALFEFITTHSFEPGYNNLPAHPVDKNHKFHKEDFINGKKKAYAKEPSEAGFGRTIIALDGNKVVADLNLNLMHLNSANHRVMLGMGMLQPYRHQGIGSKMMTMAIEFCKSHQKKYIDLYVFDHNEPAKKLYEKFGFVKLMTVKEKFIIDGFSVDDNLMVLKL